MCNAKTLNPDLTLAEAGVFNGANVFVVTGCGVKGGGMAISFTDVSKNITREARNNDLNIDKEKNKNKYF